MSADLLAAFGDSQPELSQAPTSQTNIGHSSQGQEEQPWILQSRPLPPSSKTRKDESLWKQDGTGTDVLFDASDDEPDEDDFGDFEEATANTSKQADLLPSHNHSNDIDLLGLEEALPPSSSNYTSTSSAPTRHTPDTNETSLNSSHRFGQHIPHQPAGKAGQNTTKEIIDFFHEPKPASGTAAPDDDWGNFEDAQFDEQSPPPLSAHTQKPPQIKNAEPQQPTPTENDEEDEDWDAFEDGPSEPVANTQRPPTEPATQPQPTATTAPSQPHPRPTNIPPPSTLLSLLPQIHQTLSHPTSPPSDLAQQIQHLHRTTARLTVGRSHRWKRDTHLSQLFRIGSASLKSSGMKLTSLDRSELVKEDQDAAEALASWRRHAPAFNVIVVRAKMPKLAGLDGVNVRVDRGLGVLNAREPCALCGLKRNERITGVDGGVDDTFGEFWVEFWGHRECYEFWYRYEEMLERR